MMFRILMPLSLGVGKLWTGLENAQKDWHITITEEKNKGGMYEYSIL